MSITEKQVMSIDDVLSDTKEEYAEIEGVGGQVMLIGSLTAEDLIEHNEANVDPVRKRTAGLRLITKSLVDNEGNRIGNDSHIEKLKKVRVATTERILREVLKLNGLGAEAAIAKKD